MPHLTPMSREDLPQFEEMFQRYEANAGYIPNSMFLMGRRPELLEAYMQLANVVLRSGEVPPALKSLVSHIASTAAGCRYCQAHTAHRAHSLGIDEAKLQAVWDFEHDPRFDDAERAALRLARDAAQVPNAVTGEHFAALKEHFSEEEILEIVSVIAIFGWLNRWNDTLATDLEDVPLGFAEQSLTPRGWEAGKHASA